ncbi:MAG TPA: ZIP family zinc transporter [Acidimicrobiia bacterium]|nr:ZIP family zinc transporter [Acidimicrobiia bacterium]
MFEAFLWGLLAASSLLIGALFAVRRPPHRRTLGLVMAFGAGVLLSAVSYELIAEATEVGGGPLSVVLGVFAGAAAFTFGDILIGRFQRRRQGNVMPDAEEGAGLSILLGALLDGVPETAVLGLTLLQTNEIGVAMLVAVFISNLPEGIAATTTLIEGGWKRRLVLEIWGAVVLACGLAAAAGYILLDGASTGVISFVFAFSGGAVLTMLATSMMPEAYEHAGRPVGVLTVVGFVVAYGVHLLEG